MAGMGEEGFIEVGVEPNTKGAGPKFKKDLETLERQLDPVQVEVAARLAKGFAAAARADAQKAMAKVTAEVAVAPKLAKGFAIEARKEANRALAKVRADVSIGARVDAREVRAQAAKAAKQAGTVRGYISAEVQADSSKLNKSVIAAVRSAQRVTPPIEVKFIIPGSTRAELLSEVTRVIGIAQTRASSTPLDVRFDVDPSHLVTEVQVALGEAQTAAYAAPVDVRFDIDPTKLIAQVTAAAAAAQAAVQTINVTSVDASGAVSTSVGVGTGALAGAAALLPGAAMAGLFATSIDEASSLSEALSKTQAVYGEYATEIIKWSEGSSAALGQAQAESLAAVGTMGNLMQAFGVDRGAAKDMSITLTQLASDLASFNDTSTEDALTAITSGLSGETEPLKRFGVALSDVRLKEAALAAGLIKNTKGALDPHTKALAAYQLIMKDTALAQGDFVRNGEGYANLSRTVASEFTNLKAAIGAPMQAGLLAILPTIIDAVREMTPMLVDLSGEFADTLGPAIQQFLPLIQPLVYMFGMLFSSVVRVGGAIAEILAPIVVPILSRLGDTIGVVASVISDNMGAILKFAGAIGALFLAFKAGTFLASVGPLIASGIAAVGGAVSGLAAFLVANPIGLAFVAIAAGLMAAWKWCEPFKDAITEIWVVLKDNLMPLFDGLTGMLMSLFDGGIDSGEFIGSLDNVKAALANIWDVLPGALARAGSALLEWGQTSILPALAAAGGAIVSWVSTSLIPTIVNAWLGLFGWVTGTLIPKIAELGGKLWDWVKDTLPTLIDKLSDIRSKLVAWLLGPFLQSVVTGFGKVVGAVLGWLFTDGLKMLGKLGIWLLTDVLPFLLKVVWQLVVSAAKLVGQIFGIAIDYIWEGLKVLGPWFMNTALPWLGDKLVELFKGAIGLLGDLAFWLMETITGAIVNLVFLLPNAFIVLWDWFSKVPGLIVDAIEALGSLAAKLGTWIKDTFTAFVDKLPEYFTATVDWFKGLPGRIADAIGDLTETLKDKGSDLIGGFWNGISSAASSAGGFAADIARAFVGFVNDKIIGGINSGLKKYWPDWLPGDVPQIPEIPEFAEGGLVSKRTLAIVGEAGPELILPLTDPARIAELLAEAGLLSDITGQVTSAAPATIAMPDIAPVQSWTADLVATLSVVPDAVAEGQVAGMARWGAQTAAQLAAQSTQWDRWATSTVAKTASTWETGLWRMVAATQTAGQQIAASMEGAINTSTPRLVLAVQGYATALTGALNPVLTAIGSEPIALKFADGGSVPGPRVNRDIVPALLMPGEVVIRRSSVDAFGVDNLLALNDGRVPAGWQVPRFAEGGVALASDAIGRGVAYADAAVGKPYVWGAVGPGGFDCSGLWSGIISAVKDQAPRRLFTSSSLITNAAKIGMLPGLGQISVGTVVGNPGHVGGTIAGVNYEATPPRVLKGAKARGANHPMFSHRFHVGNGFWLEPGQSINLPNIPPLLDAGALSSTARSTMDYASKLAASWVTENTFTSPTSLGDVVEAFSGSATASNARAWITTAIQKTGVPMSWLPGLMTIAQRESAFNPRAINNWDSNARKGIPSKGLMQTIDPTFRAYAMPGHGDIWNPVDNAIASIRYIQARYGDIGRVQQANPNLAPRGYASGGLVTVDDRWRAMGDQLRAGTPDSTFLGGGSSHDVDRLIAAIGSIPGGQTFNLETSAGTPDGQANALLHRLAALLG